jgi:hypothetical protein
MNTSEAMKTAFRKRSILGWSAAGLLVLAGLLLLALAWPSEPTAAGTVRLNGEPLPMGRIRFLPRAGAGPDAGAAIEEGKYQIAKGLQVGEYRVEIEGIRKSSTKKVRNPYSLGEQLVPDQVQVVAPEYNQNSKLTRVIKTGANALDFDVEEAKGKGAKTGK